MMDTKTYHLSKRSKSRYFWSGTFLIFGSLMGFMFCFSAVYTIFFTIIVFLVSLEGAYIGVFYLLSVNKTILKISESNIEFIFPFGCYKTEWGKIIQAELNQSKFRLYFENKIINKQINLVSTFFYKDNQIPIYLFLDNWKDEKSWDKEPLLVLLSEKFQWIKQ